MALIEMYDIAQAPSFRNRLVACIVRTAGNVFIEAETDNNTVDQKRRNLADTALLNPEAVAQRFVWPMLSNASIAALGIEATDSDLEYQCAQVWNVVAGVTAGDVPPE